MEEAEVHLKAFEHFFMLGGKPSQANYAMVAKEFGMTTGTINRWSKTFKWTSRAEERKEQFKARLQDHSETTLLTVTDYYRDIIHRSIEAFDANVKAGLIRFKKIEHFVSLVKLDLLLTGQPIGNNPVTVNIITGIPRPGDRKRNEKPPELLIPGSIESNCSWQPPQLKQKALTAPEGDLVNEFNSERFKDAQESDRPYPGPE